MKKASRISFLGDETDDCPVLTVEQMKKIERTDMLFDDGYEGVRFNAIFLPSSLVSVIEEIMGPFYITPGEFIADVLRTHIWKGEEVVGR